MQAKRMATQWVANAETENWVKGRLGPNAYRRESASIVRSVSRGAAHFDCVQKLVRIFVNLFGVEAINADWDWLCNMIDNI